MQPKENAVKTLLSRGVDEMIDHEHLMRALLSGKKLRVKLGIDPTKPDIHLGHTVPLVKLREFQELGHKAILIIGDFTAQIGDPSGQSVERVPLTEREIKTNMKHYISQAGKVLDIKKTEIRYNSEWNKKEGLTSMLQMAKAATFQQVIKRADFQKRIEAGQDITLLEMLYPLFQGYDSVKVKADVELGGTDQKFNLLMGRRVQRHFGMKEQDIMTFPLMEGTDGVKKMSKSYGNYIGITEAPNEMFGKLMSVPDALVGRYFELLTKTHSPEHSDPYHSKLFLAETIVGMYHSPLLAKKAEENFRRVFSKKEVPENVPKLKISLPAQTGNKGVKIMELLLAAEIPSKSEARRLITQGAVKLNEKTITDPETALQLKGNEILKIGKHRFFRIVSD